jgi:hypothetical protein
MAFRAAHKIRGTHTSIIELGEFMPGWGTGSFENEDAQSFLGALPSKEPADLESVLARAADSGDYLNSEESSIVIAAAEVVASATGKSPEPVPRQVAEFVEKFGKETGGEPSSEMCELARKAVEQVRTTSELKDLWLEADGLNEWSATLRDLERRLS